MRYIFLCLALCACAIPVTRELTQQVPDSELCLALVMQRFSAQEKAVIAETLKDRRQNCDDYKAAMQAQLASQQRSSASSQALGLYLLQQSGPRTMGNGFNCTTTQQGVFANTRCW